jgi:hypothetical protein
LLDDVVTGDFAVLLEDGNGCVMDCGHGGMVAALDGIFNEGDPWSDMAF